MNKNKYIFYYMMHTDGYSVSLKYLKKDKKIYSMMVQEIINQNTYGYHMIMTVSKKHDLEIAK